MPSIEKMCQHAVGIANDDSHGYSQADRWNTDRDCASLMYDSADAAGYPVGRGPDRTRYTGTMPQDFQAAGFSYRNYDISQAYRGCIFLRDPWGPLGHTEMYLGNGETVGAHSSETGGAYGQPGDQTGNEISVTANPGGWDYMLCPPRDGGSPENYGGTEEQGMECIYRPNGQNYLIYFDGQNEHRLAHPDEVTAIDMVYKATHGGASIPMFELGSKEAPWATRFSQAISR